MNNKDLTGKYFTDYGSDVNCPTVHHVLEKVPGSEDYWRVRILGSKVPDMVSVGQIREWERTLLGTEISEEEAVLLALSGLEL